jgi:carboxylesterase type B
VFAENIDAVAARSFGAFHGADLLFLFDNLDAGGYQATTGERALADAMQRYFASLAASRDPNAQGLPAWARYDGSQDNHLVLEGGNIRMESGLRTQKCDFWDQLLPASQ